MYLKITKYRTLLRSVALAVLLLAPLPCTGGSPACAAEYDQESAQSLCETLSRALVAGDSSKAAEHLRLLASAAPDLSRALHHGYLEGLLLEKAGDLPAAGEAYRGYLELGGEGEALLAPYAHLQLAAIEERLEEPASAAGHFGQAARLGGKGWPYYGDALLGGVRSAVAAGDCGGAAATERLLQGRRLELLNRQAGILLARCLIDSGDWEAGRRRLQLLLGENQGDDPAFSAYRILTGPGADAEESGGRSMFSTPREEAWCMGNAAYRNRRFDEAIQWLELLVDPGEGGDRTYQEMATFLIGRCRLLQGDFKTAGQWFRLAGESFPRTLSGQDGLYFNAVCHLRVGEDDAALEALQRLAVSGTRRSVALKALITSVWPLKKSLDLAGLERLAGRVEELGGSQSNRTKILMHLADAQRRRGDIEASMGTLGRILSIGEDDDPVHAEAALWLARHLAQAGRLPEALHQCLHVSRLDVAYLYRHEAREIASRVARESFAGQDEVMVRGARNLLDAGDQRSAREELEKFLLTCGWSGKRRVVLNLLQELYRGEVPYSIPYWVRLILPSDLEEAARKEAKGEGLRRAAALLRIGCYGEAAAELEAAGSRKTLDRHDRHYSIALWSMLGVDNALSVRASERLTGTVPPAAVQEALPLNVRLLQYPGHYYELVNREAEARGLDPLLVLAVVREESRFGSGVRSGAAARGLMQILPETAATVSGRFGIDYDGAADLYRPEVSIAIGTAYLASLIEHYQGNVAVALSAYNGGEANADRWLAASTDPADPFDYIREVTFRESRNYVIKVLSSYRAYQTLGTKLVGHTSEVVGSFVDWDLYYADLPAVR